MIEVDGTQKIWAKLYRETGLVDPAARLLVLLLPDTPVRTKVSLHIEAGKEGASGDGHKVARKGLRESIASLREAGFRACLTVGGHSTWSAIKTEYKS